MIVEEARNVSSRSHQEQKETEIAYGAIIADRLAGLGISTKINRRDLGKMSGGANLGEPVTGEMSLGEGRFSKANGRVVLDRGERGATLTEVLNLLEQRPDDFEGCQEIHVLGTSVKRTDFSLIIVREGASEWELKTVVKADSLPNHSIALGSFFPTVKTS